MARPLNTSSEDEPLSHQSDGVAILESLTPLERLPTELMWMLIEYTPMSIYDLRLTSHSLRSRVDACAVSVSVPFVEELTLLGLPASGMINVKIMTGSVSHIMEPLRLKLMLPPSLRRSKIGRTTNYWIDLTDFEDDLLAVVGKSLGRRIEKVSLSHCNYIFELNVVDKILGGIRIDKLQISTLNLSDQSVSHMLKTIRTHSVEHVKIELNQTSSSDKVGLLCELSLLVLSLHITQGNVDGIDKQSRYFFGEFDFDWASIFLNMLSGKLNKLTIANEYFPGYLKNEYVDILRERITKLDKRVWFNASCEALAHPLKYMSDEYSVTVLPGVIWNFGTQFSRSSLKVVHVSRDEEGDVY